MMNIIIIIMESYAQPWKPFWARCADRTEKFINFYPIIIKAKTPKLTQLFTVHSTKQWFYLTKVPISLEFSFFDLLACLLSTVYGCDIGVKYKLWGFVLVWMWFWWNLYFIEDEADRILNYVCTNQRYLKISHRNRKCEKYFSSIHFSTKLIQNWNCQKVRQFMLRTSPNVLYFRCCCSNINNNGKFEINFCNLIFNFFFSSRQSYC